MAARTTTRVLFATVIVAAGVYFAPKLLDQLGTAISDVTGATDAVVIGEGDTAIMVTPQDRPKLANCTPEHIIQTKQCDGLKILTVDARKMPFIARNTKLAWESDRPAMLTMNRSKQPRNRDAACGKFVHKYPPPVGSCDEYPMASTDQGGEEARAEEVPSRENSCQGGSYGGQYPRDGERFLVVIIYPDLVAPRPFSGTDIAKEQGRC